MVANKNSLTGKFFFNIRLKGVMPEPQQKPSFVEPSAKAENQLLELFPTMPNPGQDPIGDSLDSRREVN